MRKVILMSAAAIAAALSVASPAAAAGCGGYVNIAVWGCAPWDNNPPKAGVTPGYKPPAPKPAPIARQPIAQPQPVVPTAGGRILTDGGAGLISPGNKTGSSLISPGNRNGSGLISDNGLGVRR